MVLTCGQYSSKCFWWLTFFNHSSLWSKYCYHIPIYRGIEKSGNSHRVPQLLTESICALAAWAVTHHLYVCSLLPTPPPAPATSIAAPLDVHVLLPHTKPLSWPHSTYWCSPFHPPSCQDCHWPQTEETPSLSRVWGGDFHSRVAGLWW